MYTMTNHSTGEIIQAENIRALVYVARQMARRARHSGECFAINIWRTGENFVVVCQVSYGFPFSPLGGVRFS
jgi:hypothetical protein